jgi:hypothetical protein
MALTFASGTDGRVRDGASAVAGLTGWSIDKQLQMIPSPHFGITADANGVTWNVFTLKGLASATCDIEGHYDVGDNSETSLYIGKTVSLDLYLSVAGTFGYENLAGTVMSIQAGTNIEANKPATFKAKVQLSGTVTPAEAIAA